MNATISRSQWSKQTKRHLNSFAHHKMTPSQLRAAILPPVDHRDAGLTADALTFRAIANFERQMVGGRKERVRLARRQRCHSNYCRAIAAAIAANRPAFAFRSSFWVEAVLGGRTMGGAELASCIDEMDVVLIRPSDGRCIFLDGMGVSITAVRQVSR